MSLSKLQREWYAKLKAEGFEDIETGPNNDGLLKTDKRIEAERVDEYDARAEYYRRACAYLHEHRFPRWDRRVWELHADGQTVRAICAALETTNIRRVHETIDRIRRRMLGNHGNPGKKRLGNKRAWLERVEREVRRWDDELLLQLAPLFLK